MTSGDLRMTAIVPSDTQDVYEELRPRQPTGLYGRWDREVLRDARAAGGMLLTNADAFVRELADLCDDVSQTSYARVDATVAWGFIPPGASLFDRSCEYLVMPRGAAVVVGQASPGVEASEVRVPAGGCWKGRNPSFVRIDDDGAAVVIRVSTAGRADLTSYVVRRAGFYPRMRANVPRDLDGAADAYGCDGPVDPVPFMLTQIRDVLGPDALYEAAESWRGSLGPADRPVEFVFDDPATWPPESIVRGHLPGGAVGIGSDIEQGAHRLLAGGVVIDVHDHLVPALEMIVDQESRSLEDLRTDCPAHDPHCHARLVRLLMFARLASVRLGHRAGSAEHPARSAQREELGSQLGVADAK